MGSRLGEAERLARVGEVFAKHGIGYIVERRKARKTDAADLKEVKAATLRSAFEELGPSFMKMGQLISNRPDVISQEYVREFSKLRRKAPEIPFDEVEAVIEDELGPIDEVFEFFEEEALASASIGQVHRAVVDGEEVVVKVQRPGIEAAIRADFDILQDFVGLFRGMMVDRIPQDPTEVVEELKRDMEKQLDYTVEGRNCERVGRNLQDQPWIRVPEMHWGLTSERVLVQEYMEGEVLEDLMETGEIEGYDRRGMAKNFITAYFDMIFNHGFFHADPHPANIIIQDGTIVLIDFGSAGRLTNYLRRMSIAFYLAIVEDYPDIAADVLCEMSDGGETADTSQLEWDMEYFTDLLYLPLGATFLRSELPEILARNGLLVPKEFILVDRSIDAMTGIAIDVYPDVSLRDLMEPYVEKLQYQEMGPAGMVGKGMGRLLEIEESLSRMPELFDDAAEQLAQGDMEVTFNHTGLSGMIREIDRATSRLSYSIIVSAIVLASSIFTLADLGPTYLGMPAIGLTGFLLAGVMGVALLISIWRSGRLF